jgi:hypothetical protein
MHYAAINGLACVAAARGDDALAARLIGAAEGTGLTEAANPYWHHPAISRHAKR